MSLSTNQPPHRELSCFFVRELLPLFLEEKIDSVRKKQVTTHLASCSECKNHFEKMKGARDQVGALSQTQVAPQMVAYLKKEHHFWTEFFQAWGWKQWPATAQWVTQLTTVAAVLILTIHFFPWVPLVHGLKRMKPVPITADALPSVAETTSVEKTAPSPTPPDAKMVVAAEVQPNEATDGDETKPLPEDIPKQVAAVESAEERTNREEEEGSQTAGVASDGTAKGQGFVWRGSLKVEELTDAVTLRVTKTIEDLGGIKAGQVELGWHRGKQRYYHFILPEENYEKLLSVLNAEGLAQLKKEKHARVIKQGHMRIIMTIDEAAE